MRDWLHHGRKVPFCNIVIDQLRSWDWRECSENKLRRSESLKMIIQVRPKLAGDNYTASVTQIASRPDGLVPCLTVWLIRQWLRGTGRGWRCELRCYVAHISSLSHTRAHVSAPKNGRLCSQAVLRSRDQLILAGHQACCSVVTSLLMDLLIIRN